MSSQIYDHSIPQEFIGRVYKSIIRPKLEHCIIGRVYKSIIRPKLEYCVQMWNPVACHGNWGLILELESVQRRFTRLASKIGILRSYSKQLEYLNLTTLAERRIRGDLIEPFKMINGIVEYGQGIFRTSK